MEIKSRNKTIADVFLRRKLMDKRGSGILRMKEAMKEWKLPEPTFEENTGYFVIKFIGPYQETVIEYKEKLNERQKKAVEYTKENQEINNRTYREINNIGKVIAAKELNELVTKKILKIIGKGRTTKYVLND